MSLQNSQLCLTKTSLVALRRATRTPTSSALMSFDSTRNLTTQMAAGDPVAIESFYRGKFDLMYREARRSSGGDEATCLDIVHDAMLKALENIKTIDTEDALTVWTKRLVHSVTIDHFRSESRRLNRELRTAKPDSQEQTWEQYHLAEARILWLEEMIREMDQSSSRLMQLRYFRGWTLRRIAEAMGLKTGAVDGRIRRLVTQLQQQAGEMD